MRLLCLKHSLNDPPPRVQEEASPVVSSLRAWMQKENMDCFIVPSDDPHLRYGMGRTGFYPQLNSCLRGRGNCC